MTDDYKNEILPRLKTSALYTTLKDLCHDRDSEVIATVDAGVLYAYQRSKAILRHMGEYTLHDGDHLFRVLYLMELLLGKENISRLHMPELMLLILSAFFHDIGMAPSEREVEVWKMVWNKEPPKLLTKDQDDLFLEFKRYLGTKENEIEIIQKLVSAGNFVKADTMKGYLITEYIRQSHAQRARTIIDKDSILGTHVSNRIMFRQKDLTVVFANICYSHNEDAIGLLEMDKNLNCGQDIYACLPLIGVLLRLADVIDFDAKRTPAVLFSHLNIKHPVSLTEWQKHRSIENWDIHPDSIQFSARCQHPAIEAAIRKYCDYIDAELSVCNNIISALNTHPKFQVRGIKMSIPLRVIRDKIEAERNIYDQPQYIYRDTQFTLSKQQVVDLLMGTKLYGNPEVALRELLQNSLDACLLRKAMEQEWKNAYTPEIIVKLYEEEGFQVLEVQDNGIGMDDAIIDNYYTKVGSSFYKSIEFKKLIIDTKAEMKPTSRFGIGILSVFMVADSLQVDTMRIYGPQKSSNAISLIAEGQDSIFWIRPGIRATVGTTTKLLLRKGKNPWEKMSAEKFIESVISTIPNPPFTISIQAGNKNISHDQATFMTRLPKLNEKQRWYMMENVSMINFGFKGKGIAGSCIVALLEKRKRPVTDLEIKGKMVKVEGKDYPLSKLYRMKDNEIDIRSRTIGVDRLGEIKSEYSFSDNVKSVSNISVHGIEVPTNIFPESWNKRKDQVRLSWPFPINLVVDISSPMDLDLNSARSEILNTEKWIAFEEQLAFCIGFGIKKHVTNRYWASFLKDIILTSNAEILKSGFEKIERANESVQLFPIVQEIPNTTEIWENLDDIPF